MAKILVVDDEADLEQLVKQKFRQKIREHHYDFLFAVNGRQALEQLDQHKDVEIVLSDINMPEMDGLTLLSRLNEQKNLLKTVIVSAYGDMDNIRTAMNRGAFDFITKPVNFEDLDLTIEKTIKQVDQMRETMKAIRENNILKMYVDETVLNFMGTHEFESSLIVNESIEATVAFIDICSFTSISENEAPEKVVKLLNNYFDVMVKEIIGQGGYIDKFIGDAIMAVFRGEYHLDRAIDACLAVRKKIECLPVEFTDASSSSAPFSPRVSIGINSGEMISGNIGSANLRRLDYTVIGDVVNTAQRLQDNAKAGQIVISQYSYEKIKESFNCHKIGEVKLKNKLQPLVIYEVMD
jgi:class 3 adenylate cyclase